MTALRILLSFLLGLALCLPSIRGDDGGGGGNGNGGNGITILPDPGRNGGGFNRSSAPGPRAIYRFAEGANIALGMPASMPTAVSIVWVEGSQTPAVVSIADGQLRFDNISLAKLRSVGVERFDVWLIGQDMRCLDIEVVLGAGEVEIRVW
jgi:hypothetical protein